MELRRFGPTQRQVSVIGQGTWYDDGEDLTPALAALRAGLDLGMTHIDTAEMYGSGAVETMVGQAIAGRRDEVFLVSKVLPHNASRAGTLAACARSLARLQTDRLDCYLLHWRGRHPLADTFAAFEELEQAGKILSWGVSNFDVDDLEEAAALVGAGRLVCNQVLYHMKERAIDHAVRPWCAEHASAVVAYSPFGRRDFPGPNTAGGSVLAQIAAAHAATPRQVALRFLARHANVFVIPRGTQPKHVAENAAAGNLRLSDEEIAQIDQAFPLGSPPRSLPML